MFQSVICHPCIWYLSLYRYLQYLLLIRYINIFLLYLLGFVPVPTFLQGYKDNSEFKILSLQKESISDCPFETVLWVSWSRDHIFIFFKLSPNHQPAYPFRTNLKWFVYYEPTLHINISVFLDVRFLWSQSKERHSSVHNTCNYNIYKTCLHFSKQLHRTSWIIWDKSQGVEGRRILCS